MLFATIAIKCKTPKSVLPLYYSKFEEYEQELTFLYKHEKNLEKKKKKDKDTNKEERTKPKALKALSSRSSCCENVWDSDFSDGKNLNCH